MLYLRYSRDWKRNADEAVSEICSGASADPQKRILLVPEQSSFDAEWALCERGGDSISLHAEVLSFTRLATRVFSQVGGAAVTTLDKSGRLIALAGAMEQLRPKLKLYGGQITKPEFLEALLRIVDEFHGCGLRADWIRAARDRLSAPLAEKLEELCLILEGYESVCEGAVQDPSTRLSRLRDAILESDFGTHARIAVVGFSDFTAQELDVLEALLLHADQMTVYLTCDSLGFGQNVFSVPRKTAKTLELLAKSRRILFRAAPILESKADSELRFLRDGLFSPSGAAWSGETEQIALYSAHSSAEECASALGWLQEKVFSGARYRDLAIAYTDETVFAPMIENLLAANDIPAYFSGTRALLRHPVVRAVLYALEAAACGMDAESVSEYLKSGYSPITADEADRLENYGFVWNLRGTRWEEPFDRNPNGLQKDEQPDRSAVEAQLAELNRSRALAIVPLGTLRRELLAAADTAEQIEALARFLQTIGLAEALDARTAQLAETGRAQEAQELSQLYEILLSTMEQIYGVLGRTVRSPDEFYRFFRAALTQNTVGTVPAALDSVRVGSLSAVRNLRVKHLLILGANDGQLPDLSSSAGLLSDSERSLMAQAGLTVAPDRSERMDRELLTAYLAFSAPEVSLCVSAQEGSPSYLFTRLTKLFPNAQKGPFSYLPTTAEQAAAVLAAEPESAREAALDRLPALREPVLRILQRAAYTPDRLSEAAVRALYGTKLSLTSSRIDKFASCRFAYFLRYGLAAEERKQAGVDASLYGVFVHYVLQHTVETVQQEGGFRKVSLERTEALAERFCDQFVAERLGDLESWSARGAYLFRRNYREVLAVVRGLYDEMRQSDFIPTSFELAFERETAIPISGNLASGSLRGVVDRVDLYSTRSGQTYLRVIDYKTGKKDFDYTDLLEGVGLQMLIYLFALTREAERFYRKKLRPAGVLYFPARFDVETTKNRLSQEEAEQEHRKALRRKGLLLDDDEILRAMEPAESPIYLPYKTSRTDGSRSGDLADADQLARAERFVFRSVGKMTDEISEGRIDAEPYWRGPDQNACRWCEYKEVCRIGSGELPVRRRKAISADAFWKTLEEEEEANGDG